MATFEISQARGWYEAECRQLGLKVTARRLDELETTARRAAARVLGADGTVFWVWVESQDDLLSCLAGLFALMSSLRIRVARARRLLSRSTGGIKKAVGDLKHDVAKRLDK